MLLLLILAFNINNNMDTCHDISFNKQGIWKHDGEVHTQKTGSSKESALALFLEAKSNEVKELFYSRL